MSDIQNEAIRELAHVARELMKGAEAPWIFKKALENKIAYYEGMADEIDETPMTGKDNILECTCLGTLVPSSCEIHNPMLPKHK